MKKKLTEMLEKALTTKNGLKNKERIPWKISKKS